MGSFFFLYQITLKSLLPYLTHLQIIKSGTHIKDVNLNISFKGFLFCLCF